MFGDMKNICTFVVLKSIKGHQARNIVGYFYTHTHHSGVAFRGVYSESPCEALAAKTASLCYCRKFNAKTSQVMFSKQDVSSIRQSHADAKEHVFEGAFQKTKPELIEAYFREMDAKNMAYYFILKSGMINSFFSFIERGDI